MWIGILVATQQLLADVDADLALDRAYLVVPFLSWVPNLMVAERVLRREDSRREVEASGGRSTIVVSGG